MSTIAMVTTGVMTAECVCMCVTVTVCAVWPSLRSFAAWVAWPLVGFQGPAQGLPVRSYSLAVIHRELVLGRTSTR